MDDIVINTLSRIDTLFHPDELAYLALTSKIEMPIRDRWAYSLHRELGDVLNVSREWKRTDISILNITSPRAIIELKAMYSFDAALDPKGIGGFTDAMSADAKKAKTLATKDTEIYTVLLATHPDGPFPKEMNGIIKYVPGINNAIKAFGSSEKVKRAAMDAVNNDLKSRNVIAAGSLNGGKSFNTKVSILYWLEKTTSK